jgi:hypothetical protein
MACLAAQSRTTLGQSIVSRQGSDAEARHVNALETIAMAGTKSRAINRIEQLNGQLADPVDAQPGLAPVESVTISPPKMQSLSLLISGTAPLVQLRFSAKSLNMMREKQAAGSLAAKGKKREPKDFDALYEQSAYRSPEGWFGINASAFRNAIISVCRLVNFKMTLAKLSVFIEADGFDEFDFVPLVRIVKGERQKIETPLPNANGVRDIRVRSLWPPGWECVVRITFDADQFSTTDVCNLMARVGLQNGIGEGRANGKLSPGCGWGSFTLVTGR